MTDIEIIGNMGVDRSRKKVIRICREKAAIYKPKRKDRNRTLSQSPQKEPSL